MMHGHERSITQIKYNREGDLLFSSAKDHHPNVWYSLNGERLGTFEGHQGAVWLVHFFHVKCLMTKLWNKTSYENSAGPWTLVGTLPIW